jgi:DNA-binding winged helix-turn-helix (wHTH) protein/pimeloyl-ACP methyl ester carboxylesterase
MPARWRVEEYAWQGDSVLRQLRSLHEITTKFRPGEAHTYRFGPFQLCLNAGRLTRDGQEVKLRPRAFQLLSHLVENRGRLVSKEEILKTLWPATFASDDSLVQVLSDIRQALGPEAQCFITTVPRRGYRFDAPVNDSAESLASPLSFSAPKTRYALSGELRIAYQVLGDGPIDLVHVPGWVSHVEYGWEEPSLAQFYQGLAKFSRLILFDKRGTGLSDRAAGLPDIQQRMDDVRAVMDAAGSRRAAILGWSEGAGMAITFAAAYPERSIALVLFGAYAKREWAPDYPWAPTPEERKTGLYDAIEREWGGAVGLDHVAPSRANDPAFREWWGTYQRRSATPAAALALARMNTSIDVRDSLSTITVPTLIMHRRHDQNAKMEEGRFIADRIPGAQFAELDGEDHLPFAGDIESVLRCTQGFVSRLPLN